MLIPFAEYKAAIQHAWSGFFRAYIDALFYALFESPYWKAYVIGLQFKQHTVPVARTLSIGFRLLLECDHYTIVPRSGEIQTLFLPGTALSTNQIAEVKRNKLEKEALSVMRTACPYLAADSTDSSLYALFCLPSSTAERFKPVRDFHFVFSLAAILGQMVHPVITLVELYGLDIRKVAQFPALKKLINHAPPPADPKSKPPRTREEVLVNALTAACLSDCETTFTFWSKKARDKPSLMYCPRINSLRDWDDKTSELNARHLFILFVCAEPIRELIEQRQVKLLESWEWAKITILGDFLKLLRNYRRL